MPKHIKACRVVEEQEQVSPASCPLTVDGRRAQSSVRDSVAAPLTTRVLGPRLVMLSAKSGRILSESSTRLLNIFCSLGYRLES